MNEKAGPGGGGSVTKCTRFILIEAVDDCQQFEKEKRRQDRSLTGGITKTDNVFELRFSSLHRTLELVPGKR